MRTIFKLFTIGVLLGSAGSALAAVHYVDLNSTKATPPYLSWAVAATNIQDAVDAAVAGDEIVVTNGIYASGGRATIGGSTTNRVAVDKSLSVLSVNGPQFTTIDGGGSVRCVYLTNGASLSGFNLTNGWAHSGGGLRCDSTNALIYNCVVSGNSAFREPFVFGAPCCGINNALAGGVDGGTLNNCILNDNQAMNYSSSFACDLTPCTVIETFGGLSSYPGSGGGAGNATLNNCRLTGNRAGYGGGADNCTLNNCTLIGNMASFDLRDFDGKNGDVGSGGGAYNSLLNNCIVYFNTAPQGSNYYSCTLNNSCTTPLPTNGFGNIINAPLFVDLASGNLHLQSNSPCINAGSSALAPAGLDLDGHPRIVGSAVDMGAYEFQSPVSISPPLTMLRSGQNLALTWPTNYTEFHLQSTTNFGSSAVWTIVSPPSVVIGGQYTVTNLISAPQQFYRLIQAPWFCSENSQCGFEYECVDGICTHYLTGRGGGI